MHISTESFKHNFDELHYGCDEKIKSAGRHMNWAYHSRTGAKQEIARAREMKECVRSFEHVLATTYDGIEEKIQSHFDYSRSVAHTAFLSNKNLVQRTNLRSVLAPTIVQEVSKTPVTPSQDAER